EGEGPFLDNPDTPEVDESSSGTFQTGRLEVQFDGGPFLPLITYRSDNTDGQRTLLTRHANPLDPGSSDTTSFAADLELVDEVVDVPVNNPAGASTMRIQFNTYDAGNDWWWAVDNIQAYTGDDPGPRDPALTAVVDRTSGNVTIVNGTSKDVDLRGYEISSVDGNFDESSASFLADGDADWVQLTQSGAGSDLSEGHLTSATLASGESIELGAAWLPYFSSETDVSFQYLVSDRSEPVLGLVEVSGVEYPFLDLNFDEVVDINDWTEFLAITDTADLSDLTVAQAYRKGDLDGDLQLGVNDFITFQREFDRINGAGAFNAALAAAVPEPGSLGLLGCVVGAMALIRLRVRPTALLAVVFTTVVCVARANAAVTVDRMYRLGDDPRENAVAGAEVAETVPDPPFGQGESIDSEGEVGAGQLVVNVSPNFDFGPTYVEIVGRPDGGTGLGVQFDGENFENLLGQRLGTPSTSISSTFAGGSRDLDFILDRGLQFWTQPLLVPDTMSGDPADDDHIVMDTNNHGALINSNGRFAMRYNREDFEGVGDAAIAEEGAWYHVMVVRPDGPENGSRMYVNGVAIAAAPGDYLRGVPPVGTSADIPDTAPLIIGGATFPESN
ncbi:MAG: hypothetical protein AAF961_10475, partial [Planctomycetota bacterium]